MAEDAVGIAHSPYRGGLKRFLFLRFLWRRGTTWNNKQNNHRSPNRRMSIFHIESFENIDLLSSISRLTLCGKVSRSCTTCRQGFNGICCCQYEYVWIKDNWGMSHAQVWRVLSKLLPPLLVAPVRLVDVFLSPSFPQATQGVKSSYALGRFSCKLNEWKTFGPENHLWTPVGPRSCWFIPCLNHPGASVHQRSVSSIVNSGLGHPAHSAFHRLDQLHDSNLTHLLRKR